MPLEGGSSSQSILTASTLAVSHSLSQTLEKTQSQGLDIIVPPWRDKDLPSLPSSDVQLSDPGSSQLHHLTLAQAIKNKMTLPATPDTTAEDDDDDDSDDGWISNGFCRAWSRSGEMRIRGKRSTTSVRDLVERDTTLGKVQIRIRLWKVNTLVGKGSAEVPIEYIEDLLEIQVNPEIYSQKLCDKAWALLVELLRLGYHEATANAILRLPLARRPLFLDTLALHNAYDAPQIPELYQLVQSLQSKQPQLFHRFYNLNTFCFLITPGNHNVPSGSRLLNQFFDKFTEKVRYETGPYGLSLNWNLPTFGECFLNYVLSKRDSKEYVMDIVEHTISFLRPFAVEEPSGIDVAFTLRDSPFIRETKHFHPALPLLHFATHLCYRSSLAARVFIESGLLAIVGQMWVHNFPDTRTRWRRQETTRMRNDMRIGCLMLLGALSSHFPSTRDLADHLLEVYVDTQSMAKFGGCDAWWKGVGLSMGREKDKKVNACLHARLPSLAFEGGSEWSSTPELALFVMEMCVANCVNLCHGHEDGAKGMWEKILDIISQPETSVESVKTRDAALRVLFSFAMTPQDYWSPLTSALVYGSRTRSSVVFSTIIKEYLNPVRAPASIPGDLQKFLHALRARAKKDELPIINPIDRFLLLIMDGTYRVGSAQVYLLALREAGMLELVEAVSQGKYDCFGEDPASRTTHQRLNRKYTKAHMLQSLGDG